MPCCALCEREVPRLTEHHLVPVEHGRRRGQKPDELPTVDVCSDCHRQLHILFKNQELGERLNSVAALRAEPTMATFLAWIRRQPPTRTIRVRRGGRR